MSNNFILVLCILAIIVTILFGNTKKFRINMGYTGALCALLIGCFLLKMSVSSVVVLWPVSTVFSMFAVTFFYGFAMANGTLELMAKKIVYKCGNAKWLIPIVLFIVVTFFGAIGVEPVSCTAMFAPLSYVIGLAGGFSPFLIVTWVTFGSLLGSNFTYSLGGAIIGGMLQQTEYGDKAMSLYHSAWMNILIVFLILYVLAYIVFKGFRSQTTTMEKPEAFNDVQKKNIYIIAAVAILLLVPTIIQLIAPNPVTKVLASYCTIPVLSIAGSFVCLLLKLGNENEILTKRVPWSAIIMIIGISMLMGVASQAGMVDVIADWLVTSVSPSLFVPMLLLIAGVLSFFSSGLFVVVPMLMPLIPTLAAQSGISPVALITALVLGASITGISPISSGGAMVLACNPDKELREKQWLPQVILCFAYWVITIVMASIGMFNIFG